MKAAAGDLFWDLNGDLGESFGAYRMGEDDAMLDVVTSASVACGFHAGDPMVMTNTVAAAARRGVSIGAHVGYRDLQGFGRRKLDLVPAELAADVVYQIGALQGIARSCGTEVRYVKPHGALYNAAAADADVARTVLAGVRAVDPSLPVLTLPGSVLARVAVELGAPVVLECFADRAYNADGTLVPRSRPGAVIDDVRAVVGRAVTMATTGSVLAEGGTTVTVTAETMCVHGDTPGAARLARAVRQALLDAGVTLRPFR